LKPAEPDENKIEERRRRWRLEWKKRKNQFRFCLFYLRSRKLILAKTAFQLRIMTDSLKNALCDNLWGENCISKNTKSACFREKPEKNRKMFQYENIRERFEAAKNYEYQVGIKFSTTRRHFDR